MSNDVRAIPPAEFLDPGETRVRRGAAGALEGSISGEPWVEVKLRLAFPLTRTERMLAFFTTEDRYLGTLRDYEQLGEAARHTIEDELAEQYFQPTIIRITGLRKRYGMVEMNVVTDSGEKLIRFRSPRDDIREVGPGHYLLTDATGNRYEAPCLDAMDSASQAFWHNLV
jgi:hypothetical protein